jgi:hypothetical protein
MLSIIALARDSPIRKYKGLNLKHEELHGKVISGGN